MDWIDLSGMEKPKALAATWTFRSVNEHLKSEEVAKCGETLLLTLKSDKVADSTMFAVCDHINVSGHNPLRGHNEDSKGVRFPDMSHPYAAVPNLNIEDAVLIRAGQNVEHPVDAILASEIVYQTILAKHQLKTVYAVIYGSKINANNIIKLFQGE
ncbi:MAG: hypothetical protein U9Q91_07970 [Candidatus Marinimicrobia bacterium]|nr:hypothetical protein [Candidatus Neomarinimicrobiota bacterium]